MKHVALLLTSLFLSAQAMALSLSDLTQQDTATAMKEALTQGAQLAVSELGKPGGFSNNPDVRIELPGKLGSAARTLKMMGMGCYVFFWFGAAWSRHVVDLWWPISGGHVFGRNSR